MDEFAVAAYLGRTALAGAVVLALGRAALVVAQSPLTRQRLAAWTLRAAVLVPLLTLLPSWWAVTVPTATPVAAAVEAAEPVALPPAEPPALPVEWVAGPEFVEFEAQASDEVEPPPVAIAVEPEPVAVIAPRQRGWRDAVGVVAAVYAAGVAYFLGVFALGHLALVRLRRASTAAPGRVRAAWGSRRPPALLVHGSLASPVCFGVVRPAVVLPAGLAASATAGQLAWVLAHEADHLRRGDPLTGWFAGLAKALFFFAPWFWGVRRELRLAQEYLADAAALAAGGHAADYAEFLVDLSAAPVRGRRTLLAHGVRAGRSDLSRRITMVLSTTPPRAPKRWATPAAVGLFAVAVALSGVTIVRADDKPKEPPAAPKPPEAKPERAVETRHGDNAGWQIRSSDNRDELVKMQKLIKQLDEAIAAGKTDEAKKLVDALDKMFDQAVPPRPPAPPQPPAADRRGVMAIVSADPRIMDALTAMRKAIDATKDPEARAAMETAFKLLRDMPQERKLTQTMVGPDGRATVIDRSPRFNAPMGGPGVGIPGMPGDPGMPGGPPGMPGGPPGMPFGGGGLIFPRGSGLAEYLANLGVTVAPLPEALADQMQLMAGFGVVVTEVRPDSPFAKAGVKKSDILASVNSVRLSGGAVRLWSELSKASGKTALTVVTRGVERVVEVELPQPAATPARPAAKKVQFESMKMEIFNGGLSIEAKKGDRQYKLTGAMVGDQQIANAVITVTDSKTGKSTVQAGTVLTEMGEQDRAAVQTLLDQVRGR